MNILRRWGLLVQGFEIGILYTTGFLPLCVSKKIAAHDNYPGAYMTGLGLVCTCVCLRVCLVLDTGSHVVQTSSTCYVSKDDLGFTNFLAAGIIGIHHQPQLMQFWR